MIIRDLVGYEVWECDKEEARTLWVSNPDDRWRIWTHEEVDAHMLSDPDTILDMIQKKENQPGEYL